MFFKNAIVICLGLEYGGGVAATFVAPACGGQFNHEP
jgi:hypothetical protein